MDRLKELIENAQATVDLYDDVKEKPAHYWDHVRRLIKLECALIKMKYHG